MFASENLINHPEVVEVRNLLLRAIEEKGADYVYPADPESDGGSCFYVRDGAPSCLVGHVLHYAGVGLDTLEVYEGSNAEYVVGRVGSWFLDTLLKGLTEAQEVQDTGKTWGEALEAFDRAVGWVNE